MTTYLLPTPRAPGDHAHLNRQGKPLCGMQLHWVEESDYLCAYNLCPDCDRFAKGQPIQTAWQQASLFEVA